MPNFLRSDVLCPYCLYEIKNSDIKYFCPIHQTEVTRSTLDIIRKKAPKCDHEGCGAIANVVKCGKCGKELPFDIFQYSKNLRFSIIGVTGSGKSIFLTTMMHELKGLRDFPLVPSYMDNLTEMQFRQNEEIIYSRKMRLNANPKKVKPLPQQWRLRDRSQMTDKYIPSYSLTIFDGAGEDCQHTDPVISRYIWGAKELIILFDPLALSSFSENLPQKVKNRSSVAEHVHGASASMVNEIANFIRANSNMGVERLIDKDVAIVFTKIDEVADTFDFATVMTPSPHAARKAYVKEDGDAVDEEIRRWLDEKGEAEFVNAITSNFNPKKVRYFGVSSYGHVPNDDGTLQEVKPLRVLDPLFWMLSKEGIIPTIDPDTASEVE